MIVRLVHPIFSAMIFVDIYSGKLSTSSASTPKIKKDILFIHAIRVDRMNFNELSYLGVFNFVSWRVDLC